MMLRCQLGLNHDTSSAGTRIHIRKLNALSQCLSLILCDNHWVINTDELCQVAPTQRLNNSWKRRDDSTLSCPRQKEEMQKMKKGERISQEQIPSSSLHVGGFSFLKKLESTSLHIKYFSDNKNDHMEAQVNIHSMMAVFGYAGWYISRRTSSESVHFAGYMLCFNMTTRHLFSKNLLNQGSHNDCNAGVLVVTSRLSCGNSIDQPNAHGLQEGGCIPTQGTTRHWRAQTPVPADSDLLQIHSRCRKTDQLEQYKGLSSLSL